MGQYKEYLLSKCVEFNSLQTYNNLLLKKRHKPVYWPKNGRTALFENETDCYIYGNKF